MFADTTKMAGKNVGEVNDRPAARRCTVLFDFLNLQMKT
jgi:hypothetical protein